MLLRTLPLYIRMWNIRLVTSLLACCLLVSGCASSDVSRTVSSNVDRGVCNFRSMSDGTTDSYIVDSYANANQTTKGALVGGAAGAITGALAATGVGVIPGAATGMLLGASYGRYIDSKTDIRDQIENRGGTIVVLGDQILIVIPSDRLFRPNSAYIKPQAYSTLCLIAKYINCYVNMMVRVAAYTNDSGSSCLDMSLSKQQAQRVAKMLLQSCLDTRVLYAEGYGSGHLVMNNCCGWGSPNFRIEITLEKQFA